MSRRRALFPRVLVLAIGTAALACGGDVDSADSAANAPMESRPAPGTAAAPSAGVSPVAAPDPFIGRFETVSEGVSYRLELGTRDGQRYAGVVQVDGAAYPIAGTRTGGELSGRFNDPDGSEYPYRSRPSPNGLTFVLDEQDVVEFGRVAGGPPPPGFRSGPPASPAGPGPAAPPHPQGAPPGSAPGGWPPPPPPMNR